ncbi:helix-turn-helix domain-containing protein [Pseudoxanthomonas beigongshangi]
MIEQPMLWADRGRTLRYGEVSDTSSRPHCLAASRQGNLGLQARRYSLWVQIRGESWIESAEGRFRLRPGQWIVLDRESRPVVQATSTGLCLGLSFEGGSSASRRNADDTRVYPGRGRLGTRERLVFLRLWRRACPRTAAGSGAYGDARPLLAFMAEIQGDLQRYAQRCPGRTRSHRHQVFVRLQRARLYLNGHRNRRVPMRELAQLVNFSHSYFSRTYTFVYEEQPQVTASRIRLAHAAELLISTEAPIGEIAQASGFENNCSFSRAFRARFGVSATDYRRHGSTHEDNFRKPIA